jgi:S1-C subfamily serine protease
VNRCRRDRCLCWLVLGGLLSACLVPRLAMAGEPTAAIMDAARKVVKLYGAGGGRSLEAYQTGMLVSTEGHVLTVLSSVLDSDGIDCVLDDGRRYPAVLIAADMLRELALLRIEATELPAFSLDSPADSGLPSARVGTRVLALSNLFGVAVGDERVSVQQGVIAARIPLEARRGSHEVAYRGDVYVLDCTTNNPGSPGGALVDWQGRLLGMLGKELRTSQTGVWLNYALPVETLAAGYRGLLAGETEAERTATAAEDVDVDLAGLGIVFVPDLLERTPPFVEAIVPDSPAARAGLAADDLVVAVGGRAVSSQRAMRQAIGMLVAGDAVNLTVIHAGELLECPLGPLPEQAPRLVPKNETEAEKEQR